jgi:acetate kinase
MSKRAEEKGLLLAVNGGSSSIRFAVYSAEAPVRRIADGKIDRIGLSRTTLTFRDGPRERTDSRRIYARDYRAAVRFLMGWLEADPSFGAIKAVGHRIVHGMARPGPAIITPRLVTELRRTAPFDPDHLPGEIELVRAFMKRHPQLPQVACFDTSFHRAMPRVARILPLPRRLEAMGVVRYGFHGLSYEYLLEELARVAGTPAAKGRVIMAHLGNGASIAATRGGRSLDTSMGFTPASGLVMSTRSGDLDPGIASFLARRLRMSTAGFQDMVNHRSGLLGVSGISSDMRDLQARSAGDPRAADAVDLFCYQARKWIGAYAAVLGGIDTLVFAGGIGENAPLIRARICESLGFLGVRLDRARNAANSPLVSRGRVAVRVIPTNEELMIARSMMRVLRLTPRKKNTK